MVGKSVASGVSVAAAKQIFKKSVFLVDNVSISHNVDDICSFVSRSGEPASKFWG